MDSLARGAVSICSILDTFAYALTDTTLSASPARAAISASSWRRIGPKTLI
jgi:hypothetical protein